MNKPNPLVPQGSLTDKGPGHVRLTVFAILAVHLVMLGVLLIAGCNKGGEPAPQDQAGTGLPSAPTDLPPAPTDLPPVASSNAPATPAIPPAPTGTAPVSNQVTEPTALVPVAPKLPVIPELPPVPPPPSLTEHTVVRGDSFYTLGKKYGVGSKAIAEANPGVDSTKLKLGQKLKIPPAKQATAPAAVAGASGTASTDSVVTASGETVHVVKSGDTLWVLSRKYGVKESAIRSANNLRSSRLVVGQKLKIPGKAAPPVEAAPAVPAVPAAPATPPVVLPPAGTAPGNP